MPGFPFIISTSKSSLFKLKLNATQTQRSFSIAFHIISKLCIKTCSFKHDRNIMFIYVKIIWYLNHVFPFKYLFLKKKEKKYRITGGCTKKFYLIQKRRSVENKKYNVIEKRRFGKYSGVTNKSSFFFYFLIWNTSFTNCLVRICWCTFTLYTDTRRYIKYNIIIFVC